MTIDRSEPRSSTSEAPAKGGGELELEELEHEEGMALPDKEAMSVISADISGIDNFAMPINEAIAINNQSAYSFAIADADQIVFLNQADVDPEED